MALMIDFFLIQCEMMMDLPKNESILEDCKDGNFLLESKQFKKNNP